MDSGMDTLGLHNHKLMEKIRASLPSDIKTSKNILTVQDDVLFIWCQSDFCVLSLNLKAVRDQPGGEVQYQTLLGTQPISFAVERIRVNTVLSLIALAGPNGVCVLELPRRSGCYGTFGNGKDVVYCRYYFLDERLFTCTKFVECKQVRWHPASPDDNHLLVLTSENLIRTYKIDSDGVKPDRVFTIGKKPTGILGSSNVPFLVALGETGVDFDFATPEVPKSNTKIPPNRLWESLHWPIYILRGNGDVYMIITVLRGNRFDEVTLYGPLGMHPAADDNYGVDACAIICLESNPTVLAISTSTGTVYHCVALSPGEDIISEWEESKPKKALFVFECIELELGLSISDKDSCITCPIFFHQDAVSKSRYFCTHDTGIHAITVPLVGHLKSYFDSAEDDIENLFPVMGERSTAEYLVCTNTAGADKSNPVLGAAMVYNPGGLIALLGSGQVLSLPIGTVFYPGAMDNKADRDDAVSPTKKILKQPFDEYIKTFLKPTLTQPILQLPQKSKLEPHEYLEILQRATQTFQDEHFKKLERVREEIVKRVKALQMLRTYQENELSRLEQEKEETQKHAEKLAELYEDANEKQQKLSDRVENLLKLISQKQPIQSKDEKQHAKELGECLEKLKRFNERFEQIRSKEKFQSLQIRKWSLHQKNQDSHLGTIQTNTIKSSLCMMNQQILDMKKDVELCKQDLGLQ